MHVYIWIMSRVKRIVNQKHSQDSVDRSYRLFQMLQLAQTKLKQRSIVIVSFILLCFSTVGGCEWLGSSFRLLKYISFFILATFIDEFILRSRCGYKCACLPVFKSYQLHFLSYLEISKFNMTQRVSKKQKYRSNSHLEGLSCCWGDYIY